MREFGELLRTHRIGAGLTQQQLADFAMVSVRAIRDLECGRTRSPRAETVRLLADGLRLDEGSRLDLQQAGGRSASRAAVAPPAPAGPGGLIVGREAEAAALSALLTEGRGLPPEGRGEAGGGAAGAADGPGRAVSAAGLVDGRARTLADGSRHAVHDVGGVGVPRGERARTSAEGVRHEVGGVGVPEGGRACTSAEGVRHEVGGVGVPEGGRACTSAEGSRHDVGGSGPVGGRAPTLASESPCGSGVAEAVGARARVFADEPSEGSGGASSEGHQRAVGAVSADAGRQAVWNTAAPDGTAADALACGRAATLTTPFEPRRLITITGVSGVGKTRLALEVAGDLHFRHGWSVLWHPAHATPAVDDDQDTVLVTDHRPDPRLLDAHPRLRVIVTALAPTGLPGEHVFPLGALADEAAVRLLLTHVHRVRPAFKPEPANQAALMGLVHALDGLPSALEFAAGWFMVYSPQHLLERLRSHPLDPTSAHLRDSLRRSLSTMDDEVRALLVRMAEGQEAGHGRALQELRVRGLVRRAGDRYEVLSLVRAAVLEPVSGPHLHGSVALTWPV